ncbi:MAG: CoA transferase [Gammaproteobacteria bacterium]|nr:CoA transferase [Gammaproteobacteria bacterium]MYG14792.1 CoA transferase [Gammaproteobacteria bacterium]MYK29110.1 CoA transferase [Gammaproteobacteria bacterium]
MRSVERRSAVPGVRPATAHRRSGRQHAGHAYPAAATHGVMICLGNLNVLDLTDEMGLMCGQLLADAGAHVHQLVTPDAAARLSSPFWEAYTMGKRLEVIDWPRAPQLVKGFAAEADVLLTSQAFSELDALGLGGDGLQRINPGLIQVSITGFGATGPKAEYASTDLTIAAASGHAYLCGTAEGPPLRISADQAQGHASADAAVGVLIALADRERTGLGQQLDVSAQQSMTLALLSRSLDKPAAHPRAERGAFALTVGEVSVKTQFRCADGWVVALQGILPPIADFMAQLMDWVHAQGHCTEADLRWDWGNVAAQMMAGQIGANDWAPVQNGIERLLAKLTKTEIMEAAASRRLLLAPVLNLGDILDSAHMAERGCALDGPSGKRLGAFAKFSRTPLPLGAAPLSASGLRTAKARRPDSTPPGPPLAGVKVVDLFWVVAGPGATRMLADYGATVVHVESRRKVDMLRNVPPYIDGAMDPERAAAHHSTNANKLNITLDITTAEGKAVLRDLIRWADVLTESFAPGAIERMGFDYGAVSALNPDIIMISSALLGQTGPWRNYAGYGNLAAAVCGFHALTGLPGEAPTGCYGPYTDFTSVRFNAMAILLALKERQRTGQGQHIDMGQAEAALHFLAPQCVAYWRDGKVAEAQGNRDERYAPQGIYRVQGEDRWLALSVRSDAEWRRLCGYSSDAALLAAKDWLFEERRQRHDELDERLSTWLADLDGAAVESALQALNVPAHRALDTHDLFDDAQLKHRQHFLSAPHRDFGDVAIESTRLRFSRTQPKTPPAAPHFGIDNEPVLKEILGYDDAQVARLEQAGALR